MTDEEKAIDVPARQAKLAQILNGAQFDDVGKIAATVPMQISGPLPPVPRKRKTRSDAGSHKPRKPEPAQAGERTIKLTLTVKQWKRLASLASGPNDFDIGYAILHAYLDQVIDSLKAQA